MDKKKKKVFHRSETVHFFEKENYLQEYYRNILNTKLPIDVSHPFLTDLCVSREKERQDVQCTKCSTPWISGFYRSRLLKRPQKNQQLIKTLMRKERNSRKKLKRNEKLKLSLYRTERNTLEVTCLICKYKTKQYCTLPKRKRKPVEVKPQEVSIDLKVGSNKKKKKKKSKDRSAGLLVFVKSSKSLKKNKKAKGDATNLPRGVTNVTSEVSNLPSGATDLTSEATNLSSGDSSQQPITSEKNVSERLADSIAASHKSYILERKLIPQNNSTKASMKQRDILTKTLKSKINTDKVRNLKEDNTLANFLSSLI